MGSFTPLTGLFWKYLNRSGEICARIEGNFPEICCGQFGMELNEPEFLGLDSILPIILYNYIFDLRDMIRRGGRSIKLKGLDKVEGIIFLSSVLLFFVGIRVRMRFLLYWSKDISHARSFFWNSIHVVLPSTWIKTLVSF